MSRPVRYSLLVVGLLLLAIAVFLGFYIPTLGPRLKQTVLTALEQRFDADVQLDKLHIAIYPTPSVDGEGLVISQRNRAPSDVPMIQIRHFHARASYAVLLDWRNNVDEITLDGLRIHLPPRSAGVANLKKQLNGSDHGAEQLKWMIKTIVANRALLEIEPKPGKDPLLFPIENLVMHSVGPGEAMDFTASLTNAKPPGAIDTKGKFGPWLREDPRSTPISGDYTFQHADLSVFKGISGTLSSQGKYSGVLQHILVDGTTETPDFALSKGGTPVNLTTVFHSVVDGTDGDTILDPVDAKFGRSEFICSGGIVHHPGTAGKAIELQARTKYARMEDILALVVKGPPVMRGDMDFQSSITIPPGQEEVIRKLALAGKFRLKSATFTNKEITGRLRMLTDRASGITKKDEDDGEGAKRNVASNMLSNFKLNKGVLNLAGFSFEVPGSHIKLDGRYNLVSSALDMSGMFQMQAKLSETQSGIKSLLLKPLDRHFEKDGAGFEIPFAITGTRDHPTIQASAFHKTFSIH